MTFSRSHTPSEQHLTLAPPAPKLLIYNMDDTDMSVLLLTDIAGDLTQLQGYCSTNIAWTSAYTCIYYIA